MSSLGFPDDQERALAHGEVALNDAAVALPNPPAGTSYGPFPVAHATALRVMVAPTGGDVTATLTWTMAGVGNTASGSSTLTFLDGTATSQLATCLGHLVTITLVGSVNGVTADVWAVTANPLAPSGASPPAYAALYRLGSDAAQVITSGVSTNVKWLHFRTTDPAIFSTLLTGGGGGNTPGDDLIILAQPGVYICSADTNWEIGAYTRTTSWNSADATGSSYMDFVGGKYDRAVAEPEGAYSVVHTHTLGSTLTFRVRQTSGGNRSLFYCRAHIVYLPLPSNPLIFG